MSKRLSNIITISLITLTLLFVTVVGTPVGVVSASFPLAFSIFTGIVKKTVKNNKK